MSGAVAERVAVDTEQAKNTEQDVSSGYGFPRVGQMSVAFQLTGRASQDEMWHVVVLMLIGVAHVGAVEHERLIEQRALTILRLGQLVDEVPEALNVVAVDL